MSACLVLCPGVIVLTWAHKALRDDYRYAVRLVSSPGSGDVVLVAIHPLSIEPSALAVAPSVHADLIDRLESAGASDIVFDVDFTPHRILPLTKPSLTPSGAPADRWSCRRSSNLCRIGKMEK